MSPDQVWKNLQESLTSLKIVQIKSRELKKKL